MKLDEIRGFATDDLSQKVTEAQAQLFKLRYSAAAESLENAKAIRALRKNVAQMKTVMRERELTTAAGSSESES